MRMRGVVRGFLLEFVGVHVHSCVIQDIIVHNPVQRYSAYSTVIYYWHTTFYFLHIQPAKFTFNLKFKSYKLHLAMKSECYRTTGWRPKGRQIKHNTNASCDI